LLIVYTSGTTGRPKGAVLRQEALVWNAVMSQHMHSLTAADHVLTVLPLFHVGGLNIQTTPALQLGATVTLNRRFAPDETLSAIAEGRPTRTALIPSTIQALIEHPKWKDTDLSSLESITTGSALVPQCLVDAVTARGVPVLQVYGATETCPIAVYTRLEGDASPPGSTGQAGLHCEVCIVDAAGHALADGTAGEIAVRGRSVFCAYWRDEVSTREVLRDGWYHTGDIATRDRRGRFFVHDRKKHVIISGGENVYLAEIVRVLRDHPAVTEVAVVGRSDSVWQEVPVAYVVKTPTMTVDADTLTHYVSQRLARFKIPREFIFVESLPRNALGKVQHFRIRQQAEASLKGSEQGNSRTNKESLAPG
jgi:fatty-acyl-CoA synthase